MYENLPSTPSEAKRLGYRHYFTGKPCKHGHVDIRFTSTQKCFTCSRRHCRRQYWSHPEYHRERVVKQYYSSPERHRERSRRYRESNIEQARERDRRWRKENPELHREQVVARRAARLQRTPVWADRKETKAVYAEAQRLTEETGVEHHVYPLQGKEVSGLHVAENLEPVPAYVNLTKGNDHPERYYEEESDDTK